MGPRTRRLPVCLLVVAATLGPRTALADDAQALCAAFASAVTDYDGDCPGMARALNAFVDQHTHELYLMDAAYQQADCQRLVDRAVQVLMPCAADPDVDAAMKRIAAEDQKRRLEAIKNMPPREYAVRLVRAVGNSVSAQQGSGGVFPTSRGRVCSDQPHAQLWMDLRLDTDALNGQKVCYEVGAKGQSFAASASQEGSHIVCLDGVIKGGAAVVSEPRDVDSLDGCSPPKVAASTTTAGKTQTGPAGGVKDPAPADVSSVCAEWAASVDKFGSDCSALGKRLQRKFRSASFKLRDVPRTAAYQNALADCTRAAKATSPCAKDPDVAAALELLGQ